MVRRASLLASACCTAAFAWATPGQAAAAPSPDLSKKLVEDLSESSTRFGLSIVSAAAKSAPGARLVAPANADEAKKAIYDVVNTYKAQSAALQGQIAYKEALANRLADTTALVTVAATGGEGAIPVKMARAAVQAATDHDVAYPQVTGQAHPRVLD